MAETIAQMLGMVDMTNLNDSTPQLRVVTPSQLQSSMDKDDSVQIKVLTLLEQMMLFNNIGKG
jgi:ribosomal protein S25